VGYVTIPEDWTVADYPVIENLDEDQHDFMARQTYPPTYPHSSTFRDI